MLRRSLRTWALSGALLFAGCSCAGNPFYVYREPLNPRPAIYFKWWKEIEACSGRTGDIRRVRFNVHPNPVFVVKGLTQTGDTISIVAIGMHQYTSRPFGAILKMTAIVLARPYVMHEGVVKHEILHAILHQQKPPNHGHPPEYAEKCSGLHAWRDPVFTRPDSIPDQTIPRLPEVP